MFRNRLYYSLKPLVPWSVRMGIRRWFAVRKRRQVGAVWPVFPGSEQPPVGWPGWPEGKQFAFVQTHDVEGPEGLNKVRQLAELELSLGFRSSFNFIPEGRYTVPAELRDWLTANGFEVGVHDLRHDGKLYRNRHGFRHDAVRINQHLKDWGSVGFRSGFMLNELDWLHDLNIQHDTSTFDTDPFEPQPRGQNTIFPFWVPAPTAPKLEIRNQKASPASGFQFSASNSQPLKLNSQRGYVELPYTLPQDSTLFLLFREQSPEIWLRKLDWVAQHGGMALVNVHPDYLRFPGQPDSARTFPVEFYKQLLEYVRHRYAGRYWQPLPKAVAGYIQTVKPVVERQPRRRVCIVSHSIYKSDGRVSRYGRALVERGDEVDVLGIGADQGGSGEDIVDGARVFRIQTRGFKERSKFSYLVPLLRFLLVASWRIARLHAKQPYDLIHVHNVPDFLVFAAWLPKLSGARVILDIHDVVPEFFSSKFAVAPQSLMVRLLKLMERVSAVFADHVIIANHLWMDKYTSRSAPAAKCSVLLNFVDRSIFYPRPRTRDDGKLIILFPGSLQWHQGLDIALRAFDLLKTRLPQAELHIYGEGSQKPELLQMTRELGLEGRVRFPDSLPIRDIARVMAAADLGIVPKRADSFGNQAYSTKIMEFMAVGVPVVVSSTEIDRHYFNDSVVRFFESGNPVAMAEAMFEVLTNPELRTRLVAQGLEFAGANTWESRQGDYLRLVDSICTGGSLREQPGSLPLGLSAEEPVGR